MKGFCEITETEVDGEAGGTVPGVLATCNRCCHHCESFGTDSRAIRRALMQLSESCPRAEKNFYVGGDPDEYEREARILPAPLAFPIAPREWTAEEAEMCIWTSREYLMRQQFRKD